MEKSEIPQPPSDPLQISVSKSHEEEIDKEKDYLSLPPRLVLSILQGIKIRVTIQHTYRINDFYGYFSRDFQRKPFCVFPFISIRSGKESLMEELPWKDILLLECDHGFVISSKFFRRCRRLHTLKWCKVNNDNVGTICSIPTLRRLDISIDVFHDDFVEEINKTKKIEDLRIVTWSKNYPQPLSLEKDFQLPTLRSLTLFDFPVITTRWNFDFFKENKSLKCLELVNCVITSVFSTAISKNKSIKSLSFHKSLLSEDLLEIFEHNSTIEDLNLQSCIFENINAFQNPVKICPECKLRSINFSQVGGISTELIKGLTRIKSLKRVNLSSCDLDDTKINVIHENCELWGCSGEEEKECERVVVLLKNNPNITQEMITKMEINHINLKLLL